MQYSGGRAHVSVILQGSCPVMISFPLAFFGQSFGLGDVPVILLLIVLEGLLSADNALVLAIMVRHLPKDQQQKALLYGLGGAFVFRLAAILLVSWLIQLWWLQAIGAGYLIFIMVKHFVSHSQAEKKVKVGSGFWSAVAAVELADIAFAVDSVIVGVTFAKGPEKIWVVYTGAIIGVILLRFAAGIFIKLLDRFPAFDHLAYVLVGWVGVKLAFMAGHNLHKAVPAAPAIPEMSLAVFWSVMVVLIIGGTIIGLKSGRKPELDSQAEDVEVILQGEEEIDPNAERGDVAEEEPIPDFRPRERD